MTSRDGQGHPGGHPDDDERALAAFRDAARVPPPSPFHTVRAGRDLDDALDREVAARRWTLGRVAMIATVAAFVGASAAALAPSLRSSSAATGNSDVVDVQAPGGSVAEPGSRSPPVAPAPPMPAAALKEAEGLALVERPHAESPHIEGPHVEGAPRRARTWRAEAERLVEKGDGDAAARVLVSALATDDSAASALALVTRRFPAALDAVDADLARLEGAEAMRVRCEQRLLRARDAVAVDACRAFAQKHPQHPGARTLSYAAGRVAEDLGDLALAEEEYSRALLLSPFVGLPSTDALLSRARVRAARGDVEEARADLRLYLHNEPGAARDPTVRALAERLRLPTP